MTFRTGNSRKGNVYSRRRGRLGDPGRNTLRNNASIIYERSEEENEYEPQRNSLPKDGFYFTNKVEFEERVLQEKSNVVKTLKMKSQGHTAPRKEFQPPAEFRRHQSFESGRPLNGPIERLQKPFNKNGGSILTPSRAAVNFDNIKGFDPSEKLEVVI